MPSYGRSGALQVSSKRLFFLFASETLPILPIDNCGGFIIEGVFVTTG